MSSRKGVIMSRKAKQDDGLVQTTIRLDRDLKLQAKMACLRLGIPLQSLISTLLKRWLQNIKGAGKGEG